ncbi:unnamed protein product [Phaeothamnion confervicola]
MVFTDDDGRLMSIYPHSGHYRPTDRNLHKLLEFLAVSGVDLTLLLVDAQRTYKVAREERKEGKVRKVDTPFLVPADELLSFLAAKHAAWDALLFDELMQRARAWAHRLGWVGGHDRRVSFAWST